MKRLIKTALIALVCLPLMASAATREEAKALTIKAIAYLEQNGLDAASKAFAQKDSEFNSGELYVFVQDMDGNMLIHGANPKLNGKGLINLKDPKGRYFVKEMVDVVKTNGSGWVDYMWKHPKTGQLTPKTSYVQKTEGFEGFAGVGIFQ
ncbi:MULTISPECIES: cache domain-containing protein [Sedimenticola]|uniref:cache domain-containing protein n=1 Tax=Sedimenticola TaxID=349742 RepID=UPI00048E55A7|nr:MULTISPECIES: cache domain-containing protein [Sedimenticola]MCW8905160.1 cache domain-containing protein [Sedimenticola sp.]